MARRQIHDSLPLMSPRETDSADPASPDYLDRAGALAPLMAQSVDAIESNRRLPETLVAAMHAAGMFRMLLPRAYGGGEIDPLTFLRVIEKVARIDGSTAWVLCQTSVTAMVAAHLAPEVAREIWDDPKALLAWGPSPDARAVATEGGFRVSGNWAFASGCRHATWLGADSTLCDPDGTPRRSAKGEPVIRRMLFPIGEAAMKDIWHVIGLRGTASDGYSVKDLFVPHAHTAPRNDDLAERRCFGPLYDLTAYSMFACGFAALALGLARSLFDSFLALAQEKTPRGFKHKLANDGAVQAEVAFAEAQLRSARLHMFQAMSDAWETAQRKEAISLDQRMAIRLAGTFAIRQAKEVADFAFDTAGTTAVFQSNPFERRFRDIHTVAQQLQGRKSHYQTVGQYLLGLESEMGWF